MTYTALFLDREQKIRVNVFPEYRIYIVEHCFRDNYAVFYLAPREDGLPGNLMRTAYNENKTHDECKKWVEKTYKEYHKQVQSALDTGILCEDQEEAINIINNILNPDGHLVHSPEPLTPYRVNYRMEVKEVLVFPVFNSHQPKKKLATLKPI